MLPRPNSNICSYPPFISFLVFFLINLGIWIYFASEASSSCNGGNDSECSFYEFAVIGHSIFLLFVIFALCMIVRQFRRVRELARQRQGQPFINNMPNAYGDNGSINPYRYNAANVPIDYQTNPQIYNYNNQPQPYRNQNQANYAPPTYYASN